MTRSSTSRSDWPVGQIVSDVGEVYAWLDRRLGETVRCPGQCRLCGRCCDFQAFGHRLFLTTPEWIYFRASSESPAVQPMASGRCPYNQAGTCSVYGLRFCGCRIFGCWFDAGIQSELTESSLVQLKNLCTRYDLPYRYVDLGAALGAECWQDAGLGQIG